VLGGALPARAAATIVAADAAGAVGNAAVNLAGQERFSGIHSRAVVKAVSIPAIATIHGAGSPELIVLADTVAAAGATLRGYCGVVLFGVAGSVSDDAFGAVLGARDGILVGVADGIPAAARAILGANRLVLTTNAGATNAIAATSAAVLGADGGPLARVTRTIATGGAVGSAGLLGIWSFAPNEGLAALGLADPVAARALVAD